MRWARALVAVFGGMSVASAATATTWELSAYADLLRGRFSGVALDRDGRLTVAPAVKTLFSSGQPAVWSVAEAPDGTLFAGTGNRGRLYRIERTGASRLLWSAEQPEIFAVATGPNGALYAGTSPDGKIYRVDPLTGKATELFTPKAKYIWSLAAAPDGSLYAGTGTPAQVYRIDRNGAAELYYDTGQSHVTSLAIDGKGNVLAGTEPNGILYRISAKDKAFVLYDANLPEIRSIVPMPDGTIYAAALGGSIVTAGVSAGTPASFTSITVAAPATSITVTDSPTQAGPEIKPKPDPTRTVSGAASAPAAMTQVSGVTELSGVDKSALYKINPDNTVETLWSSKEENVYDVVARPGGDLVFGTDAQGRIYRMGADRKTVLLAQTGEGETTRLLQRAGAVFAATGEMGKVVELENQARNSGSYESPAHDAGSVARWGRLAWRGKGNVAFQTRTGNTARPDKTWSEWSAPITSLANSVVKSPNARFIQWRAQLNGEAAEIEDISVAYLPQNTAPAVRSINVSSQAGAVSAVGKTASSSQAAYTVTVTDTADTSSASAGTQSQTVSRAAGSQLQISWQADDPDGDRLAYAVWFRGEDEREWKLLRTNMYENSLLLDADILADGRYYFRVMASDRPSNPLDTAQHAEMVSAPVLIDNTPPLVTIGPAKRTGETLEATVDAQDATSALRRCEYSLDAGPWTAIEAADGVTDSPHESFPIRIERLRAGEHLLVVRVYDAANNAGLAKSIIH